MRGSDDVILQKMIIKGTKALRDELIQRRNVIVRRGFLPYRRKEAEARCQLRSISRLGEKMNAFLSGCYSLGEFKAPSLARIQGERVWEVCRQKKV